VTAVLLNFRGYDTLLEIAVLTSALVGVWALGPAPRIKETTPSPVLLGMNSVLIPLAPMICAYLLWAGARAPGGAFQAGAVLAAAACCTSCRARPRTADARRADALGRGRGPGRVPRGGGRRHGDRAGASSSTRSTCRGR
jgi:hypothetical protein